MPTTALVVAESAPHVTELCGALKEAGFTVALASPAELAARSEPPAEPDVILMSASLGLRRVALLSGRFTATGRVPAVLVFPQGDLDALETCVLGGFDYVTPPYLPALLRTRLLSPQERGDLAATVEALAAEARIHAYERDLAVAHEIQSGFLPKELPASPGWELRFRYRPARHVAGDFYDGFELPDGPRLGFMVADVCDKGISAAMFMALVRTLLRHTAEYAGYWSLLDETLVPPPALPAGAGPLVQSVTGTNRYLARHHLRQGYFVTLFFGVLDPVTGTVLFINGGHNPPVLLRRSGGHLLLPPTGPALGMMSESVFSLGHVVIQPGDTLVLYTDGVVDARSWAGARFGMPRLLDVLARPAGSAEAVLEAVDTALARHVGAAEQSDDITMLALRRRF